jgi:hypothetical protein
MSCGHETGRVVTMLLIFFEEVEIPYFIPASILNATSCVAKFQSYDFLSNSFLKVRGIEVNSSIVQV